MDSFHPLKKAFWDDVGIGLFCCTMLVSALMILGLALSVIWWIITHGAMGVVVVFAIFVILYVFNLVGKAANHF